MVNVAGYCEPGCYIRRIIAVLMLNNISSYAEAGHDLQVMIADL